MSLDTYTEAMMTVHCCDFTIELNEYMLEHGIPITPSNRIRVMQQVADNNIDIDFGSDAPPSSLIASYLLTAYSVAKKISVHTN